MNLNGFSILGIILCFLLGCAKLNLADTNKMTSEELCKILMAPPLTVPPKDRRAVNAEVRHRGISCRDEAAQTEFNQQKNMFRRGPTDY